jgi:hypothetical protein
MMIPNMKNKKYGFLCTHLDLPAAPAKTKHTQHTNDDEDVGITSNHRHAEFISITYQHPNGKSDAVWHRQSRPTMAQSRPDNDAT